jgi:hypothetical protein
VAVPKFEVFSAGIPDSVTIAQRAMGQVLEKRGAEPASIKSNFSGYVSDAERAAFDIYLQAEKLAWDTVVGDESVVFKGRFEELYAFMLSVTQSRRPRAGKTLEEIIRGLFRRLDYPFDEQRVVNGKPDFILPSEEHYRRDPRDSIIFTVKRTVRERWRQIATEGRHGLGQYLASVDSTISAAELGEMMRNRIYLVVPKDLKEGAKRYAGSTTVISFERFFEDFLDPAVLRWRRDGVIP